MSMKDDSPEYEWLWRLQKHVVRNRNYYIMISMNGVSEVSVHAYAKNKHRAGR